MVLDVLHALGKLLAVGLYRLGKLLRPVGGVQPEALLGGTLLIPQPVEPVREERFAAEGVARRRSTRATAASDAEAATAATVSITIVTIITIAVTPSIAASVVGAIEDASEAASAGPSSSSAATAGTETGGVFLVLPEKERKRKGERERKERFSEGPWAKEGLVG